MYGSLIPDPTHRGAELPHASSKAPKEQSENFQADLVLNSTNSSNIERDPTTPPRYGGSANLPAIRAPFTIRCNNCDDAIPNTHWQCSICDDGDFNICANCVEKGVLCDAPGHLLIERVLDDGKFINSTTETIAPKKNTKSEPETNIESEKTIPRVFTSENKATVEECPDVSRKCNSYVNTFDKANSVTCTSCEDYDLCMPCHVSLKHDHHPSHHLEPASNDSCPDNEFATTLYDMLEAEAWHQRQREKAETWRREQKQKVEAWSLSRRLHSL